MAKLAIKKASTDVTVYVFIQASNVTTGAGLTGLTFETASLVASYVRPGAARAALTLATQTVTGAHSDGGFVEVDATNMPGVYRLDLSDAICATGVNSVVVMLKGAANMAPVLLEIQLTDFDLNSTSNAVGAAASVTAGVTLADDAITAAKFDESTAYPLKSADTDATAVARTGADSDTLETLSDEIAAVKAETALILADTGTDGVVLKAAGLAADAVAEIADAVWDEAISGHTTGTTFGGKNQKVVPSETINDYKADVSGLATSAEVGAIALLGETVVGSYTVQDILKILAAKMVGKASGGGTTTITYRGIDDTSDVIIETVDANGNRSAMTLTV
jgi:hypothetical protein